jgi:hypothetical protein
LRDTSISTFPEYFDGQQGKSVSLKRLPIKNILVPKDYDPEKNTTFTTISVINIKNPAKSPIVRCILGGGYRLYMNKSSLYNVHSFGHGYTSTSVIYRFNISGSSLTYAGSATVDGTPLG